ncbi:matrixin family metalloprotease [Planctomycetes bacterium TBK1r]|uniref:Matrixin n=1 Tax=Stieleria magnilauensis TaxID=2527963 RepID=A0ABX5XZX5_9BACT|nr:Matrixin [Planctomycetes bacterium TBK1r]QDV87020.1 Matrixin [Planctomycetes bacterium TBK1r]
MNGTELKSFLWEKGHFHNTEMPVGIEESDLDKITLTSKEFATAVRSYQDFLRPTLDELTLQEHGRLAVADGDIGPATERLFAMPRCGFPDFEVPGAAMSAKQEANWPTACRRNIKFGLAFDKAPGMTSDDTLKAFIGAINNWNYALSDLTAVVQRGRTGAHIWAGLGRLGGSTLAWSYLAQSNCRAVLEQRYDNDRTWSLNFLSTVASHEIGHALGLPHNRDGSALMYPSIHSKSLGRRGYPNNTDLGQARGLGYSLSGSAPPSLDNQYRPMPHTPDEPDEPDVPVNELVFRGSFEAFDGDRSLGEFILARKPKV